LLRELAKYERHVKSFAARTTDGNHITNRKLSNTCELDGGGMPWTSAIAESSDSILRCAVCRSRKEELTIFRGACSFKAILVDLQ
jgi:hypothetical protein